MGIGKNLVTDRVVEHWDRLPGRWWISPTLEMFKKYVDAVLRDKV